MENKDEAKFTKTLMVAQHPAQLQRYLRGLSTNSNALLGHQGLTLSNLAKTIAEQTAGPAKIASSAQVRTAVRDAVKEAGRGDDPGWNTQGCHRSLQQIFTEIRLLHLICGTEHKADNGSEKARTVFKMLGDYEQELSDKFDEAGLYSNLLNVLNGQSNPPPILSDVGKILVLGFTDKTDSQAVLLAKLKDYCDKNEIGFQTDRTDKNPALPESILSVMTGQDNSQTTLPKNSQVEFHQFADTATELRWLGRRLCAMLAGQKRAGNPASETIDPEKILVIVPEGNDFRRRVASILDRYGIPHDAAVSTPLSHSPFGSFLLKFLSLNPKCIESSDLIWLLSSPFISASGLWQDSQRQSPRSLAQQLRKHKLRKGSIDQWKTAIGELQKYYEKRAKSDEDEDPSSAENNNRTADRLKQLDEPFKGMLGKLAEMLKEPENKNLAGWVDWVLNAIKELGTIKKIKGRKNTDQDGCVQQVKDCLDSISSTGTELMSKEAFSEFLEGELSALTDVDQVSWTAAVSVRSPSEVEDGIWQYGFAIGMTGQAMPAIIRPQGILTDADKESLGLDTAERTNQRAETQLANALNKVTKRLAMSFSVLGDDGKAVLPSVFFQRMEDALAIYDQKDNRTDGFLPNKDRSGWFKVHSAAELIADASNAVLDFECDICNPLHEGVDPQRIKMIENLQKWSNGSNWTSDSSEFTSFGETSPENIKPLSPSAMDQFGQCPYKYFAQHILGLSEIKDVDLEPDALEIGVVLHDALEQAIKEKLKEAAVYFCCSSEEEKKIRKNEFARIVKSRINQSFIDIQDKQKQIYPAILKGLEDRWTAAVNAPEKSILDSLFYVVPQEQLNAAWKKISTEMERKIKNKRQSKTVSVREGAVSAEKLLKEYSAAQAASELPKPQNYPDGFKGDFKKLEKAHQEFLSSCLRSWWPLAVEIKFNIPVFKDIPVALKGRIDRVDVHHDGQKLRILDYKSGKQIPSSKVLEAAMQDGSNLQLAAYILGIRAFLGSADCPEGLKRYKDCAVGQVALAPLRNNTLSHVSINDAKVALAQELVKKCIDHIIHGKLAPLPRKHKYCPVNGSNCDFSGLCRAMTIPDQWFAAGYPDLRPSESDPRQSV